MMLPSPDSTGAQNHDRKPNGIPLDSVRPENALVKVLAFTNVYFFESGLFNGLQPIQIKKFSRLGPPRDIAPPRGDISALSSRFGPIGSSAKRALILPIQNT